MDDDEDYGDGETAKIMARASFADAREEARTLEDARTLITLGRPDLALDLCERASPASVFVAGQIRILAIVQLEPSHATTLAISLASRWLAPATSAKSVNQVLDRDRILEALEAVPATPEITALRAQVEAAPAPAPFGGGNST